MFLGVALIGERSITLKRSEAARPEDKILLILREHPEGLTISQIANEVGMHRHSVVKYIYELTGEKKIIQRKIDPATLCYIYKKNYEKSFLSLALFAGFLFISNLLSLQIPVMFLGIALVERRSSILKKRRKAEINTNTC